MKLFKFFIPISIFIAFLSCDAKLNADIPEEYIAPQEAILGSWHQFATAMFEDDDLSKADPMSCTWLFEPDGIRSVILPNSAICRSGDCDYKGYYTIENNLLSLTTKLLSDDGEEFIITENWKYSFSDNYKKLRLVREPWYYPPIVFIDDDGTPFINYKFVPNIIILHKR